MSRSKDDSGQAFPCLERGGSGLDLVDGGMTLRQYAAIKLRVPDSGTDWLDEMIRTSQRNELAAKAMQIMWDAYDKGYCSLNNQDAPNIEIIANGAHQIADTMLKARN